ncbi:hypothetical protein [Streptosporangium sp. OZ121]|uniref:hypothetical protein n=1 Tax=Streptosporangium sp. OZ121 TaxID=3444183 RepID=UPI003F795684
MSDLTRRRKGPRGAARLLTSTALNTFVGLLGLIVPLTAWALGKASVTTILFVVETGLLVAIVIRHAWLQATYMQFRRASGRAMSDPTYFELISATLERELMEDTEEIADGHLLLYAAEVPRISVLLYRTLIDSSCQPRKIMATDLTTDPRLLTQRREYLVENRRLIESGGVILRIFVCRLSDLTKRGYAKDLIDLIDLHRSLGVQCGLAVREWLRPDQAVDFVVVAAAAVLVEEEQGDAGYSKGRSSVYFKRIDKWVKKFDEIWGAENSSAAPAVLHSYEQVARELLVDSKWKPAEISAALSKHR